MTGCILPPNPLETALWRCKPKLFGSLDAWYGFCHYAPTVFHVGCCTQMTSDCEKQMNQYNKYDI